MLFLTNPFLHLIAVIVSYMCSVYIFVYFQKNATDETSNVLSEKSNDACEEDKDELLNQVCYLLFASFKIRKY